MEVQKTKDADAILRLKRWLAGVVCAAVVGCGWLGMCLDETSSELEEMAAKYSAAQIENETLLADLEELNEAIQAKDEEISRLQGELDAAKAQATRTASYSGGTSSNSATQSATVYVTNTGSKYHKNGCQYLSQSKNAISLSNAKAAGYTACSRCY